MLVGAAVIPHSDLLIDPSLLPTSSNSHDKAKKLQLTTQAVADSFLSLDIDLIVLVTPHGISMEDEVAVYTGEQATGYALIGQDIEDEDKPEWELPLKVVLDKEGSKDLIKSLKEFDQSIMVTGVSAFGGDFDFPLRYAEVIPLSFFFPKEEVGDDEEEELEEEDDDNTYEDGEEDDETGTYDTGTYDTGTYDDDTYERDESLNVEQPRCICLSLPTRRHTEGQFMVREMLRFGSCLQKYLDSLQENVVLIVSANLAHTHRKFGPYGKSRAAQKFDEACGYWAKSLNFSYLEKAGSLLEEAKSCGYLGLVMLHGVLTGSDDACWKSSLKAISHPTYYGMMVSSYKRKKLR